MANDFIVTHNTALVSWLIDWFMKTRSNPLIVVTANTRDQLLGTTWRELAKWWKLSITSHWFMWTATKYYHIDHPEDWYAHAVPWSKEKPEAFQGRHDKNILTILDEASSIEDPIWVAGDGAMTTKGAIRLAFGNPTRNTGRFRECFGRYKKRWITRQIDSRTAKKTNKKEINEWIEDRGIDDDYVRIKVLGIFPRVGFRQFISTELVDQARERTVELGVYEHMPVIMSVDVARFGEDQTVFSFRQGRKLHPQEKFHGLDTMEVAGKIVEQIKLWNPYLVFIDGVGLGAGVVDRVRQLGFVNIVVDVQSGAKAIDKKTYANKRAEMWGRMRAWLPGADIPDDIKLKSTLTGLEYLFTKTNQYLLESKADLKARGISSPDEADSLAYGFAEEIVEFEEDEDYMEPFHQPVGASSVTGY